MDFLFGLERGQHVEILHMCSIALKSRVVNMLRFYEYVLLFWIRESSTCWHVINMFFYVGLESGQDVGRIPMFSFVVDSSVVNMLRLYEYVMLFWT